MFKRFFLRKQEYEIRKLVETDLKIGEDTLLFNDVRNFGQNPARVKIGNHCVVASGVQFITGEGVLKLCLDGNGSCNDRNDNPGIIIHDNCFIGIDSVIYPGVSIGPNAIVGAGSVVMADVPANLCVCGNPARVTCTLEFYASVCKRGLVPDYGSKMKRAILEKHFWNIQNDPIG